MTVTKLDDLAGDYVVDPQDTYVGFVARRAAVVHGKFESFRGQGHIDAAEPASSWARLEIDAGSARTTAKRGDRHLRIDDFLDVTRHPLITYRSTTLAGGSGSTLEMLGALTIRGVTKPLPLTLHYHGASRDAVGDVRPWLSASTVISRRDWGVSCSQAEERGGIPVVDEVILDIAVTALRLRTSAALVGRESTTRAVAP